jgi:hypothetical protein
MPFLLELLYSIVEGNISGISKVPAAYLFRAHPEEGSRMASETLATSSKTTEYNNPSIELTSIINHRESPRSVMKQTLFIEFLLLHP